MKKVLKERPWLLVILAFFVLIGAWTVMISLAVQNQPVDIPLDEVVVVTE